MKQSQLGEVRGEEEHEARIEYDISRNYYPKPPKNPKSEFCKGCRVRLIPDPLMGDRPVWWIQIGSRVFCKKCYEKRS